MRRPFYARHCVDGNLLTNEVLAENQTKIYEQNLKKKTFWHLFMDGVQMPQG